MPRIFPATALVLSLAACAAPNDDHMDVVFDPCTLAVSPASDASAEERASVVEALAMWNDTADTQLVLDDGSEHEAHRLEVRFDVAPAAFHGVYDDERGIVFINRTIRDARARSITVAHELGHSFGLWHIARDERLSVMNPANVDVVPQAADALSVQDRWGRCSER